MKNLPSIKMAVWALSLLFATAGVATAQVLSNNELEFTGTITSVMPNGDGGGTLFVDVDATDLRVLVNSSTEIRKGEDELAMADLEQADIILVEGKFSSSGILASRVEVLTEVSDNGFSIRGHITEIQTSSDGNTISLSLLGITIEVTDPLKSVWADVLKIGLNVRIEGTVTDKIWTATEIKLVSNEKKHGAVRFEGTITAIEGVDADRKITVAVESSPPTDQIVFQNSETEVNGDPKIGSFVEVKGKVNTDYSVTARVITVVGALEIKPDQRKMKVGQTATFTVKLRETAAGEVKVSLKAESEGPGPVVSIAPPTEVVIPDGLKTADFTVSALAIGTATITATLGTETATAAVYVGELSDTDTEHPDKELYMAFAPSHIKMGTNDTRDILLLIKQSQQQLPDLTLTSDPALLNVTLDGTLSKGAAAYKVHIEVKPDVKLPDLPVTVSVQAKLKSDPPDGPKAEVLVTIEQKK